MCMRPCSFSLNPSHLPGKFPNSLEIVDKLPVLYSTNLHSNESVFHACVEHLVSAAVYCIENASVENARLTANRGRDHAGHCRRCPKNQAIARGRYSRSMSGSQCYYWTRLMQRRMRSTLTWFPMHQIEDLMKTNPLFAILRLGGNTPDKPTVPKSEPVVRSRHKRLPRPPEPNRGVRSCTPQLVTPPQSVSRCRYRKRSAAHQKMDAEAPHECTRCHCCGQDAGTRETRLRAHPGDRVADVKHSMLWLDPLPFEKCCLISREQNICSATANSSFLRRRSSRNRWRRRGKPFPLL